MSIPVGKIIDTEQGDKVLRPTLFKPIKLLENRVSMLNCHDMSLKMDKEDLLDASKYKNRYKAVAITDEDLLPVEVKE